MPRIAHLVDEFAGRGIERVDMAVAEIADQQIARKFAESRRICLLKQPEGDAYSDTDADAPVDDDTFASRRLA